MIDIIESWKDVVGYEGLYIVSNYGTVKSVDRLGTDGRQLKGKILSPKLNSNKENKGYYAVTLYKDNNRKTTYLHRIVAMAFINNEFPDKNKMVNHIDGNKRNNNAENLEWVDGFENMQHAWDNGLMENVLENMRLKWGKSASLINIVTNEKINFQTWTDLSLFLGLNEHWLSKAVSHKNNFKKTCLKKGYLIELELG